jgi:hypothetical protein
MRRRSLYKYYSERKWAEEFLDGKLLFRSLAYFRDYEDKSVREDQNEGAALFRPEGGLIVNNLTQGKRFILADHASSLFGVGSRAFAVGAGRSAIPFRRTLGGEQGWRGERLSTPTAAEGGGRRPAFTKACLASDNRPPCWTG